MKCLIRRRTAPKNVFVGVKVDRISESGWSLYFVLFWSKGEARREHQAPNLRREFPRSSISARGGTAGAVGEGEGGEEEGGLVPV